MILSDSIQYSLSNLLRTITLVVAVGFLYSGLAYGVTGYSQFGRYLSVTNALNSNDPYGLKVTIQREFPTSIHTVGQAIQYTLQQTAYRLLANSQTSSSTRQMYRQPLPVYLSSIGPMSLKSALLLLSGDVYQLVIDPVHRLVTYRVRTQYQSL